MNRFTYKKIIFISDLHFGCRSNSLEFLKIYKDYFNKFFIPLIKNVIKDEPDTAVFCLGDVFDNKMSINVAVLNTAMEIFKDISDIAPIHCLIGNHDTYNKIINEVNSVKPLGLLNNVTIYEEPEILNINNKKVYLMPWRVDAKAEKVCIEDALEEKCNYLLCHTEVKGMKYNRFTTCGGGNGLEEYDGFTKVVSGHIHWRQEKDNLIYIGSPYDTNKGDKGNSKGIYVLDIENDEFEFIENKLTPRYIKLKLEEILEWDVANYKKKIENNYVEIEYHPTYINFPFAKLIDELPGYRSIEYFSFEQGESFSEEIEEDNIDFGDYTELRKFNLLELSEAYINDVVTTEENKVRMLAKIAELFNESLKNMKEEF